MKTRILWVCGWILTASLGCSTPVSVLQQATVPASQPTAITAALTATAVGSSETKIEAPGTESTPTMQPSTSEAQIILETPEGPAITEPVQQSEDIHPYYALTASLDYARHTLDVSQGVSFENTTGRSLDHLVFGVENLGGDFKLDSLAVSGGFAATEVYTNGAMIVGLEPSLAAGESLQIEMGYTLKLSKTFNGATGYTPRQAIFGDWYPYLAYFRPGEGWVHHKKALVGESQVFPLAKFDVRIWPGEGNLVLAASQPYSFEGGWIVFEPHTARNISWSASPEYIVLEVQTNGIDVRQYVFAEHEAAGRAALETAVQAYTLYSEVYGGVETGGLSFVEAEFFDGMEYDGLIFLSADYYASYSGSPMNFLTMLTAHETAHQWWYASVGSDQAVEPWLDEALCTYSEAIFYQRYYAYLVDWWWAFRVARYAPVGMVNSQIYDHTGFRAYVDAVYLRGALYLGDLSQKMGENELENLLRVYHNLYAGKITRSDDFDALLTAFMAPEEISRLQDNYFLAKP